MNRSSIRTIGPIVSLAVVLAVLSISFTGSPAASATVDVSEINKHLESLPNYEAIFEALEEQYRVLFDLGGDAWVSVPIWEDWKTNNLSELEQFVIGAVYRPRTGYVKPAQGDLMFWLFQPLGQPDKAVFVLIRQNSPHLVRVDLVQTSGVWQVSR